MRVIVTRAYGAYPKGHLIPEMPGNQAREMIRRGFVEEAADARRAPAASRARAVRRAPELPSEGE